MSSREIRGLENVSFESAVVYTILEEIGRGGMGVVYLAERSCMGVSDLVVLKSIRSVSSEEEAQLLKEANVATRLRHENIVKTYGLEALPYSALPDDVRRDIGSRKTDLEPPPERPRLRRGQRKEAPDPRHRLRSASVMMPSVQEKKLLLIVMDYVDGLDLLSVFLSHMKGGYLVPPLLCAFIITRICRALAYAHEYIIHRDISLDNIMIDRHGVCRLSDFGIAAAATDEASRQIAGKTIYMAPEVYSGGTVDERIDVFGLGVCLYQMLTGIMPLWTDPEQPFEKQEEEVRSQLAAGIPPPHEVRTDVPEEVSRIVERMMEPDPERRYDRIGLVGDELERNYLYARGFGPTNNSLAAYVRLFESGFRDALAEELGQLSFLRDEAGQVQIQRPLRLGEFTRKGLELVKARKGSPLYRKLAQLQKEEQRVRAPKTGGRHVLSLKYGDALLETFQIEPGELTLGRDPANRCVLTDPGASRKHAKIAVVDGSVRLEDLGTSNGTVVNGQKIDKSTKLAEGDRIQIGSTVAYYRVERDQDPPARILDLADAALVESSILDGGDVAIRFEAGEAEAVAAAHVVADAARGAERVERQLDSFSESIRQSLLQLASPAGRPLEMRIANRASRFSVTIREESAESTVDNLFGRLKRHAQIAGQPDGVSSRILLRGADRIEYQPEGRSLRYSKAL